MSDAAYSTQPLAEAWAGARPIPAALRYSPAKVGMLAFLLSEVAFFSTLITTYIVFLRETKQSDPSPEAVFHLPLVVFATGCLLTSSVTVHFAERAFTRGSRAMFSVLWLATILLGAAFLGCTANEWHELLGRYGLTISRNLFGSCYFTLVGFHAAHVTIGLIALSAVLGAALSRKIDQANATPVEIISWYWHFVDGVWIVVFSLVYLIGR
jgi:cytochrome c oxidase subunit III